MKYILILILILSLISCSKPRETTLSQDINQSIIDGFFDGDTTQISKDIYFLKD